MRELMLVGEPYITDASLEEDQAAAREIGRAHV